MDYFCPGIIYVVMMIVIWLDDAGFWKWLKKKIKLAEGMDWVEEVYVGIICYDMNVDHQVHPWQPISLQISML